MITAILMFSTLILFLILRLPLAASLGFTGLLWVYIDTKNFNNVLGAGFVIWKNAISFELVAIPLFILMGEIILRSEIASRFYMAVSVIVKRLPGGLLATNVLACSIFAAVSGSSVATAATMGNVALPELKRRRYNKQLSYGSLAFGGTLGILIPPSISMIIYGSLVGASVAQLFIAGILPGLILTLMAVTYIIVRVKLNPDLCPVEKEDNMSELAPAQKLKIMADLLPIILLIVLILYGLYEGWGTPTEMAAVGFWISVVIALLYRKLNFRILWESVKNSSRISGQILFVIIGAQIFSYALFNMGTAREVTQTILSLPVSAIGIIIILSVVYLFLGMFIDAISMMVLTVAIVHPLIVNLGYSEIWFGILLTVLLEIGLITPPVGMNLFTLQAIGKEKDLKVLVYGALPFIAIMLVFCALLIIFPEIALWLPKAMMGK